MASTINTNVATLTAQRNLSTARASLNTAINRLSSGLRIDRAEAMPLAWLFRALHGPDPWFETRLCAMLATVSRWRKRLKAH